MTSAVVELNNISKRFVLQHHKARSFQDALVNLVHRQRGSDEEFWALKGVSFEVQPGETLGIIGENGSGKSTVLKLITRILDPTTGKVAVTGNVSALIELGAGFHPDLTGRENIYLNGSIMGFSRKDMNRKFADIMAFSELERFIDMPVKHYSSGMYMRLGFSVAVAVDPDILIIDEVLAVGDEVFQRKCFDRIAEFRRRGKTIIFVSHGLPMVEYLCDRVVWLHHGVVRGQGAATQVIRSYIQELQQHDEENREAAQHLAVLAEPSIGIVSPREPLDVEIFDVQLLSAEGKEKYSYRTGETLIVRLSFRVADPTAEYVLGLELRRNDGLMIHSSSRRCRGLPDVDDDGTGCIDVEFASLPLLASTYDVTPSLRRIDAAPVTVDLAALRRSFSVWSEVDQTGIVAMEYRVAEAEETYDTVGTPWRASIR